MDLSRTSRGRPIGKLESTEESSAFRSADQCVLEADSIIINEADRHSCTGDLRSLVITTDVKHRPRAGGFYLRQAVDIINRRSAARSPRICR